MSLYQERIKISRFKRYLRLHVGKYKLITVEEAALFLTTSPSRLEVSCKNVTGKTPKQIISEAYLTKAIYLYKHKGLNVAEIAFRLGFKDESGFCHFIKKQTDCNFKSYVS